MLPVVCTDVRSVKDTHSLAEIYMIKEAAIQVVLTFSGLCTFSKSDKASLQQLGSYHVRSNFRRILSFVKSTNRHAYNRFRTLDLVSTRSAFHFARPGALVTSQLTLVVRTLKPKVRISLRSASREQWTTVVSELAIRELRWHCGRWPDHQTQVPRSNPKLVSEPCYDNLLYASSSSIPSALLQTRALAIYHNMSSHVNGLGTTFGGQV